MSLLKNVPGLSRHRTEVPLPAEEPFDLERACFLMREAVALLESYYPEGAMEWLRENRPDIAQHLRDCFRAVDAAALAEDMAQLRSAVETYRQAHEKAFKIFEVRPPVIEVEMQGGLF